MQNTACRPKITVSADGKGIVSQAGALLLAETLRVTGLGEGLAEGLARWRAPRAVHDPGKIIGDPTMTLALGGDCLADIAVLRSQPELAGPVASDPVVSRLISALAADAPRALRAIRKARAAARERAWELAGDRVPGAKLYETSAAVTARTPRFGLQIMAGLCAAAVSELVTSCDRLSRRELLAVASGLAPSTARLAYWMGSSRARPVPWPRTSSRHVRRLR